MEFDTWKIACKAKWKHDLIEFLIIN